MAIAALAELRPEDIESGDVFLVKEFERMVAYWHARFNTAPVNEEVS
jgi:hypothetical protein